LAEIDEDLAQPEKAHGDIDKLKTVEQGRDPKVKRDREVIGSIPTVLMTSRHRP